MRLSSGILSQLTVPTPTYDRSQLQTGIVHFGVGNFHRSHQAMYLDRSMNAGQDLEWGICGVGVRPADAALREALLGQDMLYTLMIKHADGALEPRVIGSLIDFLYAPDDPDQVIERMARPTTRIVSLTITEGGYNIDPYSGQFILDHPDVQHDLEHLDQSRTVFGLVVAALKRRRAADIGPFTVMSCDNIEANGAVARQCFGSFAQLVEPDLGEWVLHEVMFPNSMVDRITPIASEADRATLQSTFGYTDDCVVVSEAYEQWVLEDAFSAGRPDLSSVGVQTVADVEPYELMKLRLLNAGHQAMAYFGALAGYQFAHEAAVDPLIRQLLDRYMAQEATPTLRPVPGIDLAQYRATLIQRFANPQVADTLARLCTDTSDRIPKFLLPVVRENLAAGRATPMAAAVVASWARYLQGVDDNGQAIRVVDQRAEPLIELANHPDDPMAFLRFRPVFGDLASEKAFTDSYLTTLQDLRTSGVRDTLQKVLASADMR